MASAKHQSHRSRSTTDKNLARERAKTDKYLNDGEGSSAKKVQEQIRLSRADSDTEKVRVRNEQDRSDKNQSTKRNRKRERNEEDLARSADRKREDEIWSNERQKTRLTVEALLGSERLLTDASLLAERKAHDLDSSQRDALLFDEQRAHELTKKSTALKDRYLGMVSHDLKNPLGAVIMTANLMRQCLNDGQMDVEGLLDHTQRIVRNAGIMDRMISDLLDIERIAGRKLFLNKKRQNVCELLRECKDLFAPIVASKSLSLEVHGGESALFAYIDHDKVLQVLSNLIGNAIKFTPSQGEIILKIQKMADKVEISVTDTGPGIPKEMRAKIFEKFSQVGRREHVGLGLGLYIANWLVRAHDGRIWVESEIGKGSTFAFSLPLSD